MKFFSQFFQFKTRVEQEFGCNIKCMRTNNGGKYMSEEFLTYCEKHGLEGK